jgi:hypothetical protein
LNSRFEVTLAGTTPYLALGPDLLGIHQVIALDPLLQKLLCGEPLENPTLGFLSGFSDIFVFFKEKDGPFFQKLSTAKGFRVHFPAKPFQDFLLEARWAAEYWLETAEGGSLPPESPFRESKLRLDVELKKKGRSFLVQLGLDNPLVIHPGSGSPAKNAPLSFFQAAAQRAGEESQKQVLVVWGEAEKANLPAIREAFTGLENTRVLAEPLPLRDLAGIFSQSAAYLGNDSGVTQLASACGLRTFALFKTTDSRIWGPQANSIVLSMLRGNLH